MARHIDAEKLKCSIDSETDSIFDWDMTIEELYYNLCKLIDDEPTADVQEVKHGYWQNKYRSGTTIKEGVVSSCCDMWNNRKSQFCPNCGARMDGEGK
jgi:hypothetical protein